MPFPRGSSSGVVTILCELLRVLGRVALASHLKLVVELGQELHHILAIVEGAAVERAIVNERLTLVQVETAQQVTQTLVRIGGLLVEVEVDSVVRVVCCGERVVVVGGSIS